MMRVGPGVSTHLQVIKRAHYSILYSKPFKVPLCAYEVLTKAQLEERVAVRSKKFKEDRTISEVFRARVQNLEGYTRGHLVAAMNCKYSDVAMRESFLLTNVVPQLEGLGNGYWRKLEERTLRQAPLYKKIHIVTGPIFLSHSGHTLKRLANGMVVPDAFFKISLAYSGRGNYALKAFMVPHTAISYDMPLWRYQVRAIDIETATGLEFFENLRMNPETLKRLKISRDIDS